MFKQWYIVCYGAYVKMKVVYWAQRIIGPMVGGGEVNKNALIKKL